MRGLELLRGGKANTNYRVHMEGHDDVVLRIYERQSGARAPGLLEREGLLFERLHPSIPAIANAIYDAVGVRMDELPFTPPRVLAAIEQRRAREAAGELSPHKGSARRTA